MVRACLIDGAQVAGWLELNLVDLQVDLFALAAHKGLHAPWGIGALYVAPDLEMHSLAATCEVPAPTATAPCAPMPGYCDAGSVDRIALAGFAAAIQWLQSPAQRNRLEHARGLAASLTQQLGQIPRDPTSLRSVRYPATLAHCRDFLGPVVCRSTWPTAFRSWRGLFRRPAMRPSRASDLRDCTAGRRAIQPLVRAVATRTSPKPWPPSRASSARRPSRERQWNIAQRPDNRLEGDYDRFIRFSPITSLESPHARHRPTRRPQHVLLARRLLHRSPSVGPG